MKGMKVKYPLHIMLFVVVTNKVTLYLFIFPHGLKLKTKPYNKCLVERVLTWIEKVAAG